MGDDNSKEFEDELFGPVIFSYTDAEALKDGVLFDVTPYTRDKVNRVTASVYVLLEGFEYKEEFPNKYRDLEDTALSALNRSEDKELVEFQYKGNKLWLMDNETGGKTIMFPEDY